MCTHVSHLPSTVSRQQTDSSGLPVCFTTGSKTLLFVCVRLMLLFYEQDHIMALPKLVIWTRKSASGEESFKTYKVVLCPFFSWCCGTVINRSA